MKRNILGSYSNGDFYVYIFDDGTKIRYSNRFPRNNIENLPDFPESIDLCITHKCDGKCSFCYDDAQITGKHAKLITKRDNKSEFAQKWMVGLKPFTELALNANDLSHPELEDFLKLCQEKSVICNLTINVRHLLEKHKVLREWQDNELFKGLGVSLGDMKLSDIEIERLSDILKEFENVVLHIICGTEVSLDFSYIEKLCKCSQIAVLFLGYKVIGKGEKYAQNAANKVMERISELKSKIRNFIERIRTGESSVKAVSFDCLGYSQLAISDVVSSSKEDLERCYMGDDGSFTMYIDSVNETFSVSSTDLKNKIDIGNYGIEDMFLKVRELKNG